MVSDTSPPSNELMIIPYIQLRQHLLSHSKERVLDSEVVRLRHELEGLVVVAGVAAELDQLLGHSQVAEVTDEQVEPVDVEPLSSGVCWKSSVVLDPIQIILSITSTIP